MFFLWFHIFLQSGLCYVRGFIYIVHQFKTLMCMLCSSRCKINFYGHANTRPSHDTQFLQCAHSSRSMQLTSHRYVLCPLPPLPILKHPAWLCVSILSHLDSISTLLLTPFATSKKAQLTAAIITRLEL
jgi:hypothetical protein